jgi:hypothetical protein
VIAQVIAQVIARVIARVIAPGIAPAMVTPDRRALVFIAAMAGVAGCSSSSDGGSRCSFGETTIVNPPAANTEGISILPNELLRVFFETPFADCSQDEIRDVRVTADTDAHAVATASAVNEGIAQKVITDGTGVPRPQNIVTSSINVRGTAPGTTTATISFSSPDVSPPGAKAFSVVVR